MEDHRLGVSEKRMLSKIVGPEGEEDGSWIKLHNNELHSQYSSHSIIWVIKSRRMSWAGYVARMGRGVIFTGF
jgi:hypothetical protein